MDAGLGIEAAAARAEWAIGRLEELRCPATRSPAGATTSTSRRGSSSTPRRPRTRSRPPSPASRCSTPTSAAATSAALALAEGVGEFFLRRIAPHARPGRGRRLLRLLPGRPHADPQREHARRLRCWPSLARAHRPRRLRRRRRAPRVALRARPPAPGRLLALRRGRARRLGRQLPHRLRPRRAAALRAGRSATSRGARGLAARAALLPRAPLRPRRRAALHDDRAPPDRRPVRRPVDRRPSRSAPSSTRSCSPTLARVLDFGVARMRRRDGAFVFQRHRLLVNRAAARALGRRRRCSTRSSPRRGRARPRRGGSSDEGLDRPRQLARTRSCSRRSPPARASAAARWRSPPATTPRRRADPRALARRQPDRRARARRAGWRKARRSAAASWRLRRWARRGAGRRRPLAQLLRAARSPPASLRHAGGDRDGLRAPARQPRRLPAAQRILLPEAVPRGRRPPAGRVPGEGGPLPRAEGGALPRRLRARRGRSSPRLGVERPPGGAVVVARSAPAGAAYHPDENPIFDDCLRALAARERRRTVVLARHGWQREALRALGAPAARRPRARRRLPLAAPRRRRVRRRGGDDDPRGGAARVRPGPSSPAAARGRRVARVAKVGCSALSGSRPARRDRPRAAARARTSPAWRAAGAAIRDVFVERVHRGARARSQGGPR